jgi:ATP-dependent helicase/nuclease subunit A
MRSPNPEQLKAIEHTGGVLLSAGAGSGKTFVLVRHLLHLALTTVEALSERVDLSLDEKINEIKKEFSTFVLMTFTKKATGELKIRLRDLVEELKCEPEVRKLVGHAFEEVHISTIHGYCSRLISMGLIPGLPPKLHILPEIEFIGKFDALFEDWLDLCAAGEGGVDEWLMDILFLNKNNLRGSLRNVFSTPELRLRWRYYSDEVDSSEFDLGQFLNDYFELLGLPTLETIGEQIDLGHCLEHRTKAWFKILESFKSLTLSTPVTSFEAYKSYVEFFAQFKQMRKPDEKLGLLEVGDWLDSVRKCKDLMKSGEDLFKSLDSFYGDSKGAFTSWSKLFKSAFDFIDNAYSPMDGLTFSDLEFYVLDALRKPHVAEEVSRNFSYFIVDEFQDTSFIQYEIIRNSAKGDFNRIFCVGDVKQAIYGFRGGELGVFKECSSQMPRVLPLNNNYRSESRIINFNNSFFKSLFRLGLDYEGIDNFTVEVVAQEVPEEKKEVEGGEILRLSMELDVADEKRKLTSDEMSRYEAIGLLELVKKRRESQDGTICILYKNLKPSFYLIELLMQEGIGFTAQSKISISEDPILALFGFVTSLLSSDNTLTEANSRFLKSYLAYLEIDAVDINREVSDFRRDSTLVGLYPAFMNLSWRLGLSNSNYSLNFKAVESLIMMVGGKVDAIKAAFSQLSEMELSFDFSFGKDSSSVILQTAHGSKGLQYSHVLLGGIHNNGFTISSTSYFGKLPGSFRWKSSPDQTRPFKSPMYLFESAKDRRKDFSESKRLFYVAATRAEKTLNFVDISLNGNPVSYFKSSWICGIRQCLDVYPINSIGMSLSLSSKDDENEPPRPPLFHRDTLSITAVTPEFRCDLGLVGDMSVTGLSSIALCPRKFYLSQICKLKSPEDAYVKPTEQIDPETGGLLLPKNSAKRGTELHEILSEAIGHNFVIPFRFIKSSGEKDLESVTWALERVKEMSSGRVKVESELMMKFSLFGHMISGTADLIVYGDPLTVVDFKTGRVKTDQNDHYWMQLMLYAFAQKQIQDLPDNQTFNLVLMYIDEKKVQTKSVTFIEIKSTLFNYWELTTHLDQTNPAHCRSCSFGNLCLP